MRENSGCCRASCMPYLWPAIGAEPDRLPSCLACGVHRLLSRCERPVYPNVHRLPLLALCLLAVASVHHRRVCRSLLADYELHISHLLNLASVQSAAIVRGVGRQVKIVRTITLLFSLQGLIDRSWWRYTYGKSLLASLSADYSKADLLKPAIPSDINCRERGAVVGVMMPSLEGPILEVRSTVKAVQLGRQAGLDIKGRTRCPGSMCSYS